MFVEDSYLRGMPTYWRLTCSVLPSSNRLVRGRCPASRCVVDSAANANHPAVVNALRGIVVKAVADRKTVLRLRGTALARWAILQRGRCAAEAVVFVYEQEHGRTLGTSRTAKSGQPRRLVVCGVVIGGPL
jgi:hypothetical protein